MYIVPCVTLVSFFVLNSILHHWGHIPLTESYTIPTCSAFARLVVLISNHTSEQTVKELAAVLINPGNSARSHPLLSEHEILHEGPDKPSGRSSLPLLGRHLWNRTGGSRLCETWRQGMNVKVIVQALGYNCHSGQDEQPTP